MDISTKTNNKHKKINIIYLSYYNNTPSGGNKIIYNHSELINKINSNFNSEILHFKYKDQKWKNILYKFSKNNDYLTNSIEIIKHSKYSWFNNKIKIKKEFTFSKDTDFVIIPEIVANVFGKYFINKKIKYAIFVQNGYLIHSNNSYKEIDNIYKNSEFILSYSKEINDCLKIIFPFIRKKILRTSTSIKINKFKKKYKKENLITYMPRKLSDHAKILIFFLERFIPKNWRIKKIDNLNELETFKYLYKSKIFLSFSNLEGLGLPPLEAALAGNKVIGYTGEAGKEYWKKPIFTEIYNGDLKKFYKTVLNAINNKVKINNKSTNKKLFFKYSEKYEEINIIKMLKKIETIIK
jgi:hypothetical protein